MQIYACSALFLKLEQDITIEDFEWDLASPSVENTILNSLLIYNANKKLNFHINNFLILPFWYILRHQRVLVNCFKSQGNTQVVVSRSCWQVMVATLLWVTWPKRSHLIHSNQVFNHGHDRMFCWYRSFTMCIRTNIYDSVVFPVLLPIDIENHNHYWNVVYG